LKKETREETEDWEMKADKKEMKMTDVRGMSMAKEGEKVLLHVALEKLIGKRNYAPCICESPPG